MTDVQKKRRLFCSENSYLSIISFYFWKIDKSFDFWPDSYAIFALEMTEKPEKNEKSQTEFFKANNSLLSVKNRSSFYVFINHFFSKYFKKSFISPYIFIPLSNFTEFYEFPKHNLQIRSFHASQESLDHKLLQNLMYQIV